jgi:structural maintenance of chromosome 2
MESMDFDSTKWETLNNQKRQINTKVSGLNEKCQSFYSKFPQLNLEYKNPEPNFDRNRVKGLVSNLFRLRDPKFSTALEVCAGGKLYNLVVDTDKTGKLILQHGELKRKTTIIPMNQIRAFVIPENVVRTAKNLVGQDQVLFNFLKFKLLKNY